jgi:hypothetical protein
MTTSEQITDLFVPRRRDGADGNLTFARTNPLNDAQLMLDECIGVTVSVNL